MSGLLHAAEYRVGSSWDAVSRIAIVAEKCRGKSARPLNQTTRWNGLKSTMMGRWKGNIGRVQTDLLILTAISRQQNGRRRWRRRERRRIILAT